MAASSLRKRLLPALVLTTLLAAGAAGLWWWRMGPLTVAVTRPERGDAVDAIYATGSVEPTVMLPIAPRVGGRLAQRLVDEGAQVRKGQVLARLDDADLTSTVEEQNARVDYARSQHARISALAARGFISAGEGERARTDLAAAEASLRRAQAQRDYMALTSPADGVIIRRDGEVGQYVAPGQQVFVLACCAPLRVSADIDEEDINRVHVGQAVLLKADAIAGQVFDGVVSEVTPKGDPVARSYRVRIGLPAPGALQIGMTVDGNLIVARHEKALLLPATAVHDETVWLIEHGQLQQRKVSTGIRTSRQVEIIKGLEGSEQVVLHPDASLQPGRAARAASPASADKAAASAPAK